MIEFNKLNDFLNLLVLENRKIILPLFRKIINVETKTDLSPVTEADKSTEKNIRSLSVYLKYNGPLVAPIQAGEKVAELVVTIKDEVIKSLPLYAAEDLKKVNFFKSLITSLNYLIWGDV